MSEWPANVERWTTLVREILGLRWPGLDYRWVLAQVQQESGGDHLARSPVGAMGLLQLMPPTARELGVIDPYDARTNLDGGIRYLLEQYQHFPEIPDYADRLRWSWAAFNGGRGFCNKALALARSAEREDLDEHAAYLRLMQSREPGIEPYIAPTPPTIAGHWSRWDVGSTQLASSLCAVTEHGRTHWPDHQQIIGYVRAIEAAGVAHHALFPVSA